MIAKNIGIRRARNPFVLCTNIDIVFSDGLCQYLASHRLQKGYAYRCNRCDVPQSFDENDSLAHILKWCESNILRRIGKNRWCAHSPMWGTFWYRNVCMMAITSILTQVLIRPLTTKRLYTFYGLDTEACGDFTLMSKDDWLDIKGYIELDAYSLHIDSLALSACVALGKRQVILPAAAHTYHISHQEGWHFNNIQDRILFDIKKPVIPWSTLKKAMLWMLKHKRVVIENPKDWGYADEHFEEYSTCQSPVNKHKTQTLINV